MVERRIFIVGHADRRSIKLNIMVRPVCFLVIAVSLAGAATDPSLARLEQQIEYVSHATDGVVGVERDAY